MASRPYEGSACHDLVGVLMSPGTGGMPKMADVSKSWFA